MAQGAPAILRHAGWPAAIAVCISLLCLRSWFFAAWEGSYFDSDQAIVGLMAKHLAEGRAWPLFIYGQEYMLAVEAWAAAPVVALLGSSVASLRAALILLNLATGLLLVRLLVRDAGLSTWVAALASSPFWIAPVVTAAHLSEFGGGNIEPFLWILVVWTLRRQPLWLGVCLGIGFLNREFTIYAVPPLVLAQIVERRAIDRPLIAGWFVTAAGFLLMLQLVELAKPHADLYGPNSAGMPFPVGGRSVAALLVDRLDWQLTAIGGQLWSILTDYLPALFGLTRLRPSAVGIDTRIDVGWPSMMWVVGAASVLTAVWLTVDTVRRRRSWNSWLFPAYLIAIGVIAVVAYAVAKPVQPDTMRYGLLVLVAPIGMGALALHQSRTSALRVLAGATLAALALAAAIDHVRVLAATRSTPPSRDMRAIANRLQAEGISVARSDYWRAYVVTYLTDEAVKVSAPEFERIAEYARLAREADAARAPVPFIKRTPCDAGIEVGGMYICRSP